MKSAEQGDQPKILFWNDFGKGGGETESWHLEIWVTIWARIMICITPTILPRGSGMGWGGGRLHYILEGYETILYSCGDLGAFTLSNGDFNSDAGNDIGVLEDWILFEDKNLLLTGSNLYFDLMNNVGPAGVAFAENWLGVELTHKTAEI